MESFMPETASAHPLIELAKRKPYAERPKMPADAVYSDQDGVWLVNGVPAARAFGGAMTKKCDQETGEDQKGE
jgi:hypothetical protein